MHKVHHAPRIIHFHGTKQITIVSLPDDTLSPCQRSEPVSGAPYSAVPYSKACHRQFRALPLWQCKIIIGCIYTLLTQRIHIRCLPLPNTLSILDYIINNAYRKVKKVVIIGAGFVGSLIACALALRDIAREVVLIDINKEKCAGEAKNIRHGLPSIGATDLYSGDYSDCADSDLIIITAGRNRNPGETRLDMASENAYIV